VTASPIDHSPLPRDSGALDLLQVLTTPVWVLDLGLRRVTWANQAAVEFWQAVSATELYERDLGSDLAPANEARLLAYSKRLEGEARLTEQWVFYRGAAPVTANCSFSRAAPVGEGPAFLVEATPVLAGSAEAEGDTLRAVEAFRHTTALVSVIDLQGTLLMENPAAFRAYGRLATSKTLRELFTASATARSSSKRFGSKAWTARAATRLKPVPRRTQLPVTAPFCSARSTLPFATRPKRSCGGSTPSWSRVFASVRST